MAKRLIDANYLVNKGIRNCPIEDGGIPLGDFHQHQRILALYPTVDAVEVVRCRDCKYYTHGNQSVHWSEKALACFRKARMSVKPDDFCSFGERKAENG